MKRIFSIQRFSYALCLALALVCVSAMTSIQANAGIPSATPVWACAFHGKYVQDNRYYVIIKGGTVDAYGQMVCTSWNMKTVTGNVHIALAQSGIGIGFGFPVNNGTFNMMQVKVGVSTPEGMMGSYQLSFGPGVTLLGARIGVDGGVATNPDGSPAAVLQVTVEQLVGIGVDLTGSWMTISPWK